MPVLTNKTKELQTISRDGQIIDVYPGDSFPVDEKFVHVWLGDDIFQRIWNISFEEEYLAGYPSISFASAVNSVTGYGKQGKIILGNMIRSGLDVHGHEVTDSVALTKTHVDDWLRYPYVREDRKVTEWGVVHSIVDTIIDMPTPKTIMWSMWEADRLPGLRSEGKQAGPYEDWTGKINRKARAVIVPATEQKRIFTESGVEVPIYVVHDAIDITEWPYVERKGPTDRPFTFFSWALMNSRKAPLEAVNCFLSAFGPDNPNVRLIMKTFGGNFGGGKGNIPNFNASNVTIINEIWGEEHLRNFVRDEVDAGFFLSKGEGFYDPPLEALSTGLPVIIPDHSGPHDFADSRYVYVVDTDHMEPAPQNPEHMKWWIPNYDQAIAHLKDIYENYDKALKRAKKGSEWVAKRWSVDHARTEMMNVLNEVCHE